MFRTRRTAAALAALAIGAGLALTTALPAFAVNVQPPDGSGSDSTVVRILTQGGMPGWQITLIAAAAAAAAAVLTAIADRAMAARRSFAAADSP